MPAEVFTDRDLHVGAACQLASQLGDEVEWDIL
jgi:hypothetical protein